MTRPEVRYSVVCQGKRVQEAGRVVTVCPGWGRWGTPDERCPVCGERVLVTNTVMVVAL